MTTEHILQLYSSCQAVSLAAWLGDPLSSADARSCLVSMCDASRDRWSHRRNYFNQQLAQMIVRYWAGQGADMDYCNLAATADNIRDLAQLELSYGQLLLARKLASAWPHLDAGFSAAANLLEPEDYFVVLNRHERLRLLVLSSQAACAADLEGLLKEADVIRQLRGNPRHYRIGAPQHKDTLD